MKLIELLVQELPKRGGWPKGIKRIGQDYDKQLRPDREFGIRLDMLCENYRGLFTPSRMLDDSFFVTREQYEAALSASQQPAWNGEGLPPVGTECGARKKSPGAGWWNFKVEHLSSGCVFGFWKKSGVGAALDADEYHFMALNPIPTEAERKREEFAKSLCDHLDDLTDWDSPVGKVHALAIYDAIAAGEISNVKLAD